MVNDGWLIKPIYQFDVGNILEMAHIMRCQCSLMSDSHGRNQRIYFPRRLTLLA